MNETDEKDVVRIKYTIKINEIELIDEQIETYEKTIEALRDDVLWEKFHKGYEYDFAATPLQRFQQIAACETILKAWKSIKTKIEYLDGMKHEKKDY